MVVGRWRLCSGEAVFNPKEAGVELTADRRWHVLIADDAGKLVRATGFDVKGAWYPAIENGRALMINDPATLAWTADGAPGTWSGKPKFLDTPTKMSLSTAIYVLIE